MIDSRTRDLAISLVAAVPRVLIVVAPPGYGKLMFASTIAAGTGAYRYCKLPAEPDNAAQTILDALVAADPPRAARLAVDRLARRQLRGTTHARESLRREWPDSGTAGAFVLHDSAGVFSTQTGADIFGELVRTSPASRALILCTRTTLPPALDAVLPAAGSMTLTRDDLALSRRSVLAMAQNAGLGAALASEIFTSVHGWPMITKLLIENCRTHPEERTVDHLAILSSDKIFDFVVHTSIAHLSIRVREALTVASFFPDAGYLDLVRILGPECDDAVFERVASLPYVARDGDRIRVHVEIGRLLRERFSLPVRALYDQTVTVLSRAGGHLTAARIALDAGDSIRAAEIIDAAPPFTAAPVPIGEYERVIERIDPELITRFPNLWVATISYRAFAIEPATYIREAETIYFCLQSGVSSDQRAAVLMMLASAYANVNRGADADELVAEALRGFASEGSARAALLNFCASLRGIDGRFSEARALAQEASEIARDSFGTNQTLHYIEAHEAAFRGRQDRLVVIYDELMQRRGRVEPPLYFAYVAMNGAWFSWANGDDDAFTRYQTAFEDAITPAIEAALARLIDYSRGRSARTEEYRGWPLYAAMAELYRLAAARSHEEALDAARAAVAAADQRGAPYTRTLAHVARYIVDEAARPTEAAVLAEIASKVESSEWRDAIQNIIAGRPAGILEPFVRRRVLRERERTEPMLVVELLAGRVTRGGAEIRLREKEFELVALLASNRGSLSRDEIGEALWEHLDVPEWSNNLKVTLYRIRKALGTREITLTEGSRHRLAPSIDVDLRRAETLVRSVTGAQLDEPVRASLRSMLESYRDGTVARYERFSWSHTLVARLNDLACTCGTTLATDALQHGGFEEALAYAAQVRGVDHLNEKACEITIRALQAQGDVDAARREFQRHAAALARELATTPSASLADLVSLRV
jgi:DNA-binding SARP family transcriptional activator